MLLVASRFLATSNGPIDLATGEAAVLRRLPPCPPPDERAWIDACADHLYTWHEDLPPLLDYGFMPEGRFEAYGALALRSLSPQVSAAVTAFLTGTDVHGEVAGTCCRVGMKLVPPGSLVAFDEILEDGGPGHPVSIACVAEPGAGGTTFLRLAAARARVHGYVPVAARVLDRRPELLAVLRGRSVLLLGDADDSAYQVERWFFRLGIASVNGHVMLRIVRGPARGADVTLHLEPMALSILTRHVHVYPKIDARRIRTAAELSGGLPARFLAHIREPQRGVATTTLRVAEAHPAYTGRTAVGEPEPEPELEHPWKELIENAVQQADRGRAAAAARDLRQIAAAAERRQLTSAAGVAEVALGHVLLSRGRTREAQELFAARAERHPDALATRAALGLGYAHLLHGELEAAESTFRVCRAVAPVEAGIGLGWTLLAGGRDEEAERAAAAARASDSSRCRANASVIGAAIALVRQDLPGAATAAGQALATNDLDRTSEALASMVLTLVHGRIGEIDAVERHAKRAMAAARAARSPLLAFGARVTLLEARNTCGLHATRVDIERWLRRSERAAPLPRATLVALAARHHPVEQRRAELVRELQSFVRTTGARVLSLIDAHGRALSLASDAAALVAIHESTVAPADTLKRVSEWLRERVQARAVLVCDALGAPLARGGAQDPIAAAARVLQTRVTQPPWISAEGLEAGVVIRYGGAVRGAVACRWPLSRQVPGDVVAIMTAAGAVLGPCMALMADRADTPPASSGGIVGRSRAMERLRGQISRAASAPYTVLIEGESGAGKELVARAIHRESPRRLRPCVAINCAALTDDLFEAEVFGHARGAFTGAHIERPGLFEQADGGTLFLDEVSELSARAQAKLLRALQEGEVRRLGENHPRRVDVRVVAASNRRLEEEAAGGRFRRDLLFRLAVIRLVVPSLRERREDIPLLAAHYWDEAVRRTGARSVLTSAAVARLAEYEWPGNVRELQNVMAALAVQVPRGRVGSEHVAAQLGTGAEEGQSSIPGAYRLDEARRAFERQFIAAAIARAGGRHGVAAKQLGISRQGLAKLVRRLDRA